MTGRRKEVPGMSEGGVYSGDGSTDNCLRPSRRHSSPSCQHRAKLFKAFASIACGRRGRAGPGWEAQAEVDRLLEILKEVENEKNDKDKKIAELER